MTKRLIIIIALISFAAFEGFYLMNRDEEKIDDKDYIAAFNHSNRIFSLLLPGKVAFAGEEAPLGLYYVREGLDRELTVNTYWQSSTLLLLKKTNRYFHIIRPILKKYGIPDDFKYVVLIESGLANVVSSAQAAGFWQIIPATGKRYGLEITDEVDERYHLEKATETACKILKNSYGMFGNWTLAAAAYNAGEGKIERELKKQGVHNYYDLYLGSETSRYIYRVLALKLLYEHPTEFGYYLRKKDLYPPIPTYTVTVDSTIHSLVDFASYYHVNYKIFKEFNPWLIKDQLSNPDRKKYVITLPKQGFEDFDNLLKDVEKAEDIFNDTVSSGKLYN
jgi:hypothetical protein